MIRMKYLSFLIVSLSLTSCASMFGKMGFMKRESSNTYAMFVGGAVDSPEDTFDRGAYEICKKDHKNGGYEVIGRDWQYGSQGSSYLKGRVKCTGKKDDFLYSKFENSTYNLKLEPSSSVDGFDQKFKLVEPKK